MPDAGARPLRNWQPKIEWVKAVSAMTKTIKVTLVKSAIGREKKIDQTLRGLGLTRLNKTVELENTSSVRGMINKVLFLVKIH